MRKRTSLPRASLPAARHGLQGRLMSAQLLSNPTTPSPSTSSHCHYKPSADAIAPPSVCLIGTNALETVAQACPKNVACAGGACCSAAKSCGPGRNTVCCGGDAVCKTYADTKGIACCPAAQTCGVVSLSATSAAWRCGGD
jgi:hypothetical protein